MVLFVDTPPLSDPEALPAQFRNSLEMQNTECCDILIAATTLTHSHTQQTSLVKASI